MLTYNQRRQDKSFGVNGKTYLIDVTMKRTDHMEKNCPIPDHSHTPIVS